MENKDMENKDMENKDLAKKNLARIVRILHFHSNTLHPETRKALLANKKALEEILKTE